MTHDELTILFLLAVLGLALVVAWDQNRPRR